MWAQRRHDASEGGGAGGGSQTPSLYACNGLTGCMAHLCSLCCRSPGGTSDLARCEAFHRCQGAPPRLVHACCQACRQHGGLHGGLHGAPEPTAGLRRGGARVARVCGGRSGHVGAIWRDLRQRANKIGDTNGFNHTAALMRRISPPQVCPASSCEGCETLLSC